MFFLLDSLVGDAKVLNYSEKPSGFRISWLRYPLLFFISFLALAACLKRKIHLCKLCYIKNYPIKATAGAKSVASCISSTTDSPAIQGTKFMLLILKSNIHATNSLFFFFF